MYTWKINIHMQIFYVGLFWFLFIMNPDTLENRLRDALLRSNTELNNYRKLYKQSQEENASLRKISSDLDIQNKCLSQTNRNLYQRESIRTEIITELEREVAKSSLPKLRKKISELQSRSQICLRKKVYRRALGRTINSFPDAVAANVSLNVGTEWIDLKYSKKDLRQCAMTSTQLNNARNVATDHSYSGDGDVEINSENEASDDSDTESVFELNGKFTQRHKRSVGHVMDLHKISEKAYHELRLSCKGILPPLCQVRKERLLMSSEIPYFVNPTVRFSLFFFLLFFFFFVKNFPSELEVYKPKVVNCVVYILQNDAIRRNLKVILNYLALPQDGNKSYVIKFSTDGAKLTNTYCGVQGTIRILDVTTDKKIKVPSQLPARFHRELCVFYFLG